MHVLASKRQGIFLCFCGLAGLFLCILPVYLGCFTLFLIKSSYLSKKKKKTRHMPFGKLTILTKSKTEQYKYCPNNFLFIFLCESD